MPTFRQDALWDWLDSFPDHPWKQSGRQSEPTLPPVIKLNTNKLVHNLFFYAFFSYRLIGFGTMIKSSLALEPSLINLSFVKKFFFSTWQISQERVRSVRFRILWAGVSQ